MHAKKAGMRWSNPALVARCTPSGGGAMAGAFTALHQQLVLSQTMRIGRLRVVMMKLEARCELATLYRDGGSQDSDQPMD